MDEWYIKLENIKDFCVKEAEKQMQMQQDKIIRDMLRHHQSCRFCENPDSILTKETCCTGCSKLDK